MNCENCLVKHYDMNVDGNSSTQFMVVGLDFNIIGSCMLFLDGWIQDFHIMAEYRSGGVGSFLLDAVEKVAKEKRIPLIEGLVKPENQELEFWKKKGFSEILETDGIWIKKEIK